MNRSIEQVKASLNVLISTANSLCIYHDYVKAVKLWIMVAEDCETLADLIQERLVRNDKRPETEPTS